MQVESPACDLLIISLFAFLWDSSVQPENESLCLDKNVNRSVISKINCQELRWLICNYKRLRYERGIVKNISCFVFFVSECNLIYKHGHEFMILVKLTSRFFFKFQGYILNFKNNNFVSNYKLRIKLRKVWNNALFSRRNIIHERV